MNLDPRFKRPPIIIGGCGRSGTTLLLAVLSAHPSILAIPRETEAFCPTAWSGALDLDAPFEIEKVTDYLAEVEPGPKVRRWCEKSPKNILFFGRILEFFGQDVRLIHIIRDGRDVVTSYHPTRRREKPWVPPERWVADVTAGLAFDDHPQVHLVRYEDLINRFEPTIEALCRFLGEEVVPEILNWHRHATVRNHVAWGGEVKNLHTESLARWKRPEFREYVDALMADPQAIMLLRHYGYLDR